VFANVDFFYTIPFELLLFILQLFRVNSICALIAKTRESRHRTHAKDTYIHAYIHTHTHTYIPSHTYIHTYIHTHPHIHTYIHKYRQTYIHTDSEQGVSVCPEVRSVLGREGTLFEKNNEPVFRVPCFFPNVCGIRKVGGDAAFLDVS